MKPTPQPAPTLLGALKNIGRGLYTRTARFAGYSAANSSTTTSIGSRIGTNSNSTFAAIQRVGMAFTAEMVTKDNPLAAAYLAQRQNYCSSMMSYIPNTGDSGLDAEIKCYLHGYDGFGGVFSRMGVACSMQDAFMRTADIETPVRGDAGLIFWRENESDDLRLIEFSADQLGEIYQFTSHRHCSLERGSNGEIKEVTGRDCLYYAGRYFRGADCVAYKIYERTQAWYGSPKIYAAADVLYFRDPASYRGVRGVTFFANAIAHMQKSEDLLQAALSAAQRQARTFGRVFNNAGEPDQTSYETDTAGRITFFEKVPGSPVEEYYYNGDSAEFAAPNTPSAEVIAGIETADERTALALRLPYAFLISATKVGGAPSRLEMNKTTHEFSRVQNTIHRPNLSILARVVLLDAMQRKIIQPGKSSATFLQGRWQLPISPSVDAFYDVKENIAMARAGMEAPQDIIAETNRNADDVLMKSKQWAIKCSIARQEANKELKALGYQADITSADIAQNSDNPQQAAAAEGIASGKGAEGTVDPVLERMKAYHDYVKGDGQSSESESNVQRSASAKMAGWDEGKHPRGQPENAGEFGPGGGGNALPSQKKSDTITDDGRSKSAASNDAGNGDTGGGGAGKRGESKAGDAGSGKGANTGISPAAIKSFSGKLEKSEKAAPSDKYEAGRKALAEQRASGALPTTAHNPKQQLAEGGEHHVELSPDGSRVIKHTKDGYFGFQPDVDSSGHVILRRSRASEYLSRIELQNKVFGSDLRIEGSHEHHGGGLTVSQTHFTGRTPSNAEVDDFLKHRGFVKESGDNIYDRTLEETTWFNPKLGVVVGDAKPDNFKRTEDGQIHVLDLMISKVQPQTPLFKSLQNGATATMSEWEESKHPRADDGEFGSGGGSRPEKFDLGEDYHVREASESQARKALENYDPKTNEWVEVHHPNGKLAGQALEPSELDDLLTHLGEDAKNVTFSIRRKPKVIEANA